MKKILLFICLCVFAHSRSVAQLFDDDEITMNFYGIVPPKYCGLGGGVGFTFPTIKLMDIDGDRVFGLRLGYDVWGTRLFHREIKGVPLEAPQRGNASVFLTESASAFNFNSRFVYPLNDYFSPYADIFGGVRFFKSGISIFPDSIQPGYERYSYKDLTNIEQPDFGAGIGLQVQLGDMAKLDAEVMCTRSNRKNDMFDISSARLDGSDLVIDKIMSPRDVVVVKVGVMFLMGGSGSGGSGGHYHSGGHHGGGGGHSNSVHIRSGGRT